MLRTKHLNDRDKTELYWQDERTGRIQNVLSAKWVEPPMENYGLKETHNSLCKQILLLFRIK